MIKLGTGFHRLPFSNFRYFLTLFSKFFASFPHGTCALSVSHRYLALYGIYHTIWAAIPSNSTRWRHIQWHKNTRQEREYHPLSCLLPKDLVHSQLPMLPLQTTIRCASHKTSDTDSHGELFLLQSPLLEECLLVSFPPLNYMLKFRGYSYLIWDPR